MKAGMRVTGALLTLLAAGTTVACSHPVPNAPKSWDPKAAAAYLDYRAGWWMEWTGSARDHGTVCVSCHTALPYALARPVLRTALGESAPSVNERRLIDNVIKRVRLWKEIGPYYSDQGYDHKTEESRGTEAVLNALILASHDAQTGQLSDDTRIAFENMWSLERTLGENRGSWPWLRFDRSHGKPTILPTMARPWLRWQWGSPQEITARPAKSKARLRFCENIWAEKAPLNPPSIAFSCSGLPPSCRGCLHPINRKRSFVKS